MIVLEDLTIGQFLYFLKIARPEDLNEVKVLTGHDIYKESIEMLRGAKAVIQRKANEPDCLLGIGAIELDCTQGFDVAAAIPWLLMTQEIEAHKIEFLRFSKRYLNDLLKRAFIVANVIDPNNSLHVKWLEWLGCKWDKTPQGQTVFYFERGEEEAECAGE